MQIVIDIAEEYIKQIDRIRFLIGGKEDRSLQINVINAIKKGIPLPKGHGRLIDADITKDLKNKIKHYGKDYKFTQEEIPEGATNGEVIKAMFNISDSEIDEGLSTTYIYTKTRVLKGGSQDRLREQITFDREWWNSPYKGSEG